MKYGKTISKARQAEALALAREIAGDNAEVMIHRGQSVRDVAIKVYGCWPETAQRIGAALRDRLNDGEEFTYPDNRATLTTSAGFVAVWL